MVVDFAAIYDWWLLSYLKNEKAGKINGKQFVGSTIVSTPMMMELAVLECTK
jgi:hypothetical protein